MITDDDGGDDGDEEGQEEGQTSYGSAGRREGAGDESFMLRDSRPRRIVARREVDLLSRDQLVLVPGKAVLLGPRAPGQNLVCWTKESQARVGASRKRADFERRRNKAHQKRTNRWTHTNGRGGQRRRWTDDDPVRPDWTRKPTNPETHSAPDEREGAGTGAEGSAVVAYDCSPNCRCVFPARSFFLGSFHPVLGSTAKPTRRTLPRRSRPSCRA